MSVATASFTVPCSQAPFLSPSGERNLGGVDSEGARRVVVQEGLHADTWSPPHAPDASSAIQLSHVRHCTRARHLQKRSTGLLKGWSRWLCESAP